MSRKHKKEHVSFNRRNSGRIGKEKAGMDLSRIRIRAGMAAVSALLFLSPVVISAAGSIANPAVLENTGVLDSGQADSPCSLLADSGSTGSTAADAGSTLAADPQNTGAFPSSSNTSATGSERDRTETATDKDDSDREQKEPEADIDKTDKDDSDDADGDPDGKENQDEDADSTGAANDGSEDEEGDDKEASGTGSTDSELAEESEGQDSEQEDQENQENEDSAVFSNYGSNDFASAITPEIVRIPADEWAAYGESAAGFLEREKDFFATGTPISINLKSSEYSASIQNDSFDIEKTEDRTAVVIEAASLKDGTGVYENVVEYVFRDACSTSDGKKGYLILTLEEARIELPEGSGESASGRIAVSSVSDDHTFTAEAQTIPASVKESDEDRETETEAVDVRVSEKWSARIVWHEGNEAAEPRTYLFIPDLDEVFGDPASETYDRERVAMLSGFTGKAFCCEEAAVSVSPSGYLEGNGQPDAVILPIDSTEFQFAWGGTNCSTDLFAGFDRIESKNPSETEPQDKDDPEEKDDLKDHDKATDADADSGEDAQTDEEAIPDEAEGSTAASMASMASILISHAQEPEKTASLSAGDTVELSMMVKNNGSELLRDVEVSELLDDDAELTVAWNRSSDSDTEENTLSEGETVPVTVTYTVTQDDLDTGKLVRKTEARAETADKNAVGDEQTSEVILKGTASIDFSKKASIQQISDARAGAAIQYFFTVTNSGSVTLRDIEVIDQMEGLSPIEYDWEESTDSRTGEGYLSPGERVTASATYAITSDDIRKGKIVNKAFARGETLQGKTIESSEPEAPTSISQEGKEGKRSGSPETGDDTDIIMFLMPFIGSAAILIGSYVLREKQKKKMTFDDEEED